MDIGDWSVDVAANTSSPVRRPTTRKRSNVSGTPPGEWRLDKGSPPFCSVATSFISAHAIFVAASVSG